jgi:predicted nucleic acid-binding Zn ribbon protein
MAEERARRSAEQAAVERILGSRPRKERRRAAEWSSGRDPALAGELVEELVAREGWALDVSLGTLAATWPDIVGVKVAEHCAPEEFDDGELTVRADSPAWATQIRLLGGQLVEALARSVGEGVVREVRVVGPASKKRRGPYIARR